MTDLPVADGAYGHWDCFQESIMTVGLLFDRAGELGAVVSGSLLKTV